jgi:hypothetical protein
MQYFNCYGDDRNKGFCVHCGGPSETDDHIPSKVLLDEPYPENLMVCSSCWKCNNSLSIDEDYVACLLECVLAGEVNPSKLQRPKIANVLDHNKGLQERLRRSKSAGPSGPVWNIETDRVRAVVLKLARGHAAYELNEPQLDEPAVVSFSPLINMTDEERDAFERPSDEVLAPLPEVGSRSMQRLFVAGPDLFREGWVTVQDGNYRFYTSQENGLAVKIVLREYLACQVNW